MDEATPVVQERLVAELRRLGLSAGQNVLVHGSMRALGFVCGGPAVVVRSFLEVLGSAGTLVVPSYTPDNRDPSRWHHRKVPERWWPAIREHLPAYDPVTAGCRELGLIAETVRAWPGAVRSPHPQTSFSGVGVAAEALLGTHDLDCELGERSPLAALDAVGAYVVLLGVGYDRNTCFHLAEYRTAVPPEPRPNACVVLREGRRQWVSFVGARLDSSDFARAGSDLEREPGVVRRGRVGQAGTRLFSLPAAVSFARSWFEEHRYQ